MQVLHIYAQGAQHHDVHIIGAHDVLVSLGCALLKAAAGVSDRERTFYCADGEGYNVKIECREPTESDGYPYILEEAGWSRDERLKREV